MMAQWTRRPTKPRRRILRAGAQVALVIAMLCSGCTFDQAVSQAGIPGTSFPATIEEFTERGPYYDATVVAKSFEYRFFFPATETCREVLQSTDAARFTWLGLLGRVAAGEQSCDPIGVLSLQAWRNRQPRRSREPLPRAPASYTVTYRDNDMLQIRGRFPLASQLGFTGTGNMVVVIPNDDQCQNVASARTSSMEFRASGSRPLVLLNAKDQCPVLGLAQPLAQPRPQS